jgi:hypothetical protein
MRLFNIWKLAFVRESGTNLIVTDPVDGEEDKDSASDQRTTDFVNEKIIPMSLVLVANGVLERRLRGVEVELVANSNPDDFEGVKNNRSTRRSRDILLSAEDENEDSQEENAEGKEVCSPETDFRFKLSGCETGETSNVDCPVEPGVHALDGDGGIDDHAFARFEGFDVSTSVCILFNDQSGDIGLDSSCSESNNDHGDNETSGVGGVARGRDRRANKDELTAGIDDGEKDNGLVASKVLIRNNCACDRSHITL